MPRLFRSAIASGCGAGQAACSRPADPVEVTDPALSNSVDATTLLGAKSRCHLRLRCSISRRRNDWPCAKTAVRGAAPGRGVKERAAHGEHHAKRDRAAHEAERIDEDQGEALDAQSIEQPHRVSAQVGGEEPRGDVAGAPAPVDLSRLQKHRRRSTNAVQRRRDFQCLRHVVHRRKREWRRVEGVWRSRGEGPGSGVL